VETQLVVAQRDVLRGHSAATACRSRRQPSSQIARAATVSTSAPEEPSRSAAAALKANRKLRVTLAVKFTPTGGSAFTLTGGVNVVRK
jgi:hypothetical protein